MTAWNEPDHVDTDDSHTDVLLDRDTYQLLLERMVDLDHLPDDAPLTEGERAAALEALADLDRLATEIGSVWKDGMSATDAVKEQRREL
jgi:hypothetical protein